MIQFFSQWTTSELNFPKVAVHFLSVCDEWLWLPKNSDPLSHLLSSCITFSTKCVAIHFSKKQKSNNVIWEWVKHTTYCDNILISTLFCWYVTKHLLIYLCGHAKKMWAFIFIRARISFQCLNSKAHSVPKFWHCSQMRSWPCTSLSVALYSTAALSGHDSMTCFPAPSWIAAGTSLQLVY